MLLCTRIVLCLIIHSFIIYSFIIHYSFIVLVFFFSDTQISLDELKGSKANGRKGPAPQNPRSGPGVESLPADLLDDVQHAGPDTERAAAGGHARLDDVDGGHDETGGRSGDGAGQKGPGGPECLLSFSFRGASASSSASSTTSSSASSGPLSFEFLVQDKPNGSRGNVPQ